MKNSYKDQKKAQKKKAKYKKRSESHNHTTKSNVYNWVRSIGLCIFPTIVGD